ncbi:MAG: methionine--tRNA ligase [Thermostichus sp. DG_1_6_bins_120]
MPDPTFVITTPIYYVNAAPHIGSAYTTMIADAIARYQRLRGKDVLMVTGTDEHGQKIQRTAEERGVPPQQHCDEFSAEFVKLWQLLNIRYDRFIRTTDPRHKAIVQEFFQRVWEQGDIFIGRQQGWYCVSCEEFKDEAELLEGGFCPLHPNKKAEWKDEENYFFRLSRYQQQLETLYANHPEFIQPESRRNEVLSFVKQGLRDFSISRPSVSWGIPFPTDPQQTLYVWFDALINYLSAAVDPAAEPTLANALRRYWPADVHLVGKDIVRFHAIYWPAMLMSARLPLPKQVFGHGFLTKDGMKMGKSLGNTLDPFELTRQYGPDAVRYYFLTQIEVGKDGDFSESRFIDILNADLANDLGNLLNRTLNMLKKYGDYRIPAVRIPEAHPLKLLAQTLTPLVAAAYEQLDPSLAAQKTLSLAQASNKYLDEQAPWSLHKQGKSEQVAEILYAVLESVRWVAVLLSPIVPDLSLKILQQLGFQLSDITQLRWDPDATWGQLPPAQEPQPPTPIFQKILKPSPS